MTGISIAPPIRTTDFFTEVAKGNVPGHSLIIVRGHNPDLGNGTLEDVWEAGGALTYATTARTQVLVSDDDEDGGAGTDTGALTVFVEGVDGTGAYTSSTVTMNGTTNATATTETYLRVNFMTVLTAGSGGTNLGSITATATTDATIQDQMDAGEGLSQSSHHTIPLATTGYLYQVEINGARLGVGGATPEIEFRGLARPTGASRAWLQLFDKNLDTSVTDELDIPLPFPVAMPARTDIRMTATADVAASEARTRMYIMIVDD